MKRIIFLLPSSLAKSPGKKYYQPLSTPILSRKWKYTGPDGDMSWSGGSTISKNGGSFSGSPITVARKDKLVNKVTSSSSYSTPVSVLLTVSGWDGTSFTVTTLVAPSSVMYDGATLIQDGSNSILV